jgi:hypothetical protein
MRIDYPNAITVFDVLKNQVPKQRRFAGAAFADAVKVLPAIGRQKAEGDRLPPSLAVADKTDRLTAVIDIKVCIRHSRASPRSAEAALGALRRTPGHSRT